MLASRFSDQQLQEMYRKSYDAYRYRLVGHRTPCMGYPNTTVHAATLCRSIQTSLMRPDADSD